MEFLVVIQNNAVVFYGVVALVSLLVGSFLNVVIYRLPIMMENEWRKGCRELDATGTETADDIPEEVFNLSQPASRCPGCNKPIRAWQNIPIISYLFLLGKCGSCGNRISPRYPIIEFVTAFLSVLVAMHFGPSWQCAAGIVITWCLICLTMIDIDHLLLPDSITLPLMWLGLIASLFPVFAGPTEAIIGAAAGYLTLWSVYWVFKLLTGKEGMGYGDFKLLAALGAWFGWASLPTIVLLSSLVGAIVGVTLILVAKRGREVPIPFGPYLAAAGWLSMIWGESLSGLYGGGF